MNILSKNWVLLAFFSTKLLLSQSFQIETNQGTLLESNDMVCSGRFWTEAEGKAKMEAFSELWNDAESWEKRAQAIRENMLAGLQWDKVSAYEGKINVINHSKK